MHRVRSWAHTLAHENQFNPWSQSASVVIAPGAPSGSINASNSAPAEKDKHDASIMRRFLLTLKRILFYSWVNILLVFVPVGIATHFAGVNPNVVFALNAIAIIPLAGLLTFATESVAHRLGPTLGALLNVSFGNAVELIIFIIALVKNQIRIVQASLIGSILANLLLILGMAFVVGGLQYQEQVYDSTVTQMSACLLALAVLSLLVPTAFHASFNDNDLANTAVVQLSRGTSVILLIVYFLYILFQLKSHSYLYRGTPQHVIDEESAPGILARFDSSTSSSGSSVSTTTSGGSRRKISKRLHAKLGRKRREEVETEPAVDGPNLHGESSQQSPEAPIEDGKGKTVDKAEPTATRFAQDMSTIDPTPVGQSAGPGRGARGLSFRPPPVFRASTEPVSNNQREQNGMLYHRRSLRPHPDSQRNTSQMGDARSKRNIKAGNRTQTPQQEEPGKPPMSQTASIILLLASTGLVALCAEFLVGSIEHLVENTPLSEAFIGLIILPIVGNAAEHVTAVTVAAKNKMDLALGVSLGSSIQIALFVTPLVVILGWILNKDMSLYFNLFETMALFVSTFIVNFLVLDGRSNYLEGALLCACYVIVAVGAFLFPDEGAQSTSTIGPH